MVTVEPQPQTRFPQGRLDRMVRLITERRSMSVAELVVATESSEATIRRDLRVLADAGRVRRTRGGASARDARQDGEPLFLEKMRQHQDLKARIGKAAADRVASGQTVLLDSGTTALAVARHLAGRTVSVIAMDIKVAEAAASGATEVHVLGGRIRNAYYSLVGPTLLSALDGAYCDIFVLGADAIGPGGVMTATLEEAQAKQAAIAAAGQTILVADHSKLGQKAPHVACGLDAVDRLITDRGAGARLAPYRDHLRAIDTV